MVTPRIDMCVHIFTYMWKRLRHFWLKVCACEYHYTFDAFALAWRFWRVIPHPRDFFSFCKSYTRRRIYYVWINSIAGIYTINILSNTYALSYYKNIILSIYLCMSSKKSLRNPMCISAISSTTCSRAHIFLYVYISRYLIYIIKYTIFYKYYSFILL